MGATYARVMAKTLGGEAEHEAEKLASGIPWQAVTEVGEDRIVVLAGERR
jgi:hypothetical protein